MPGPRDYAQMLRDSGDGSLTADETITFTVNGGVPLVHPLSVCILFPQDLAEASDTVACTVKCTTTNHKIEVTHTDAITYGNTFPRLIRLPLPPSTGTAWSLVLNVTDADAGGDFDAGAVEAWIEGGEMAEVDAS